MTTACIIWTGAIHDGYPMIGRRRAHRVAYEQVYGQLRNDLVLHHTCDHKACVNPDHLEPMTQAEHMRLHRTWAVSVDDVIEATDA